MTAALDIRRLGHQSPLSSQLLAAAADGYLSTASVLTGRAGCPLWLRSPTGNAGTPMALLCRTYTDRLDRAPGSRSDLPLLRAERLLDQHTRQLRQARLGPAALWDALVTWTVDPRDLYRLGELRNAVVLQVRCAAMAQATARGDTSSAVRLTWVVARTGNRRCFWTRLAGSLVAPTWRTRRGRPDPRYLLSSGASTSSTLSPTSRRERGCHRSARYRLPGP